MATFGSNRKHKIPGSVGYSGIFLVLFANLQFVATSVTWTAPPPAWTQTNANDIRTVVVPVLIGSTQVSLSWNYNLSPGSNLQSTEFSIGDSSGFDTIGKIFHTSGIATVFDTRDYRTRFNISRSEVATLIMNEVTKNEEAVYECELETVMNKWRYRIQVTVTVPIGLTNVSRDQTVHEGSNMTLFCEATGRPTPNITWTRVFEDYRNSKILYQGSPWVILNISRTASGTYRCTADNGLGNPVSQVFRVNVTYPAKIVKLVSEHEVQAQQSVSLDCQAEGNPSPTYYWTPCGTSCDPQQIKCHESLLIFQASDKSVYTFTCKVANNIGTDTRNTTLFIASDVINVTLVITSEDCTNGEYNQLWEKLRKMIDRIFAGKLGFESVQQKNIRCGSVIVDLALKFSSTVRESEVLSVVRDAVKNGEFGDFNVSAITGTRYTGIPATIATAPTSSSDIQACGDCACSCTLLGVMIGILVLIIIALVVYIIWLHKKVVAGTLDLYGNEADFFLALLCSYLTSTITTTCCLNTCPSQVHTVQSLSVILPQPSNNLNSDVFLDSLDDWQSPPDSNCGRKFATKPSGGIPFIEVVTLDEDGNANMPWHCAGVRVSSPRSMLNLKSFIVFSVDLLSRAGYLKLSNTPMLI